MEEQKKVSYIPDDALMDIKVSGTFYRRMQALFIYLAEKKDIKQFLILYAALVKGKEPSSEYEFHLNTILSMIIEMEKVAKENNLVQEKDGTEFIEKVKQMMEKSNEN